MWMWVWVWVWTGARWKVPCFWALAGLLPKPAVSCLNLSKIFECVLGCDYRGARAVQPQQNAAQPPLDVGYIRCCCSFFSSLNPSFIAGFCGCARAVQPQRNAAQPPPVAVQVCCNKMGIVCCHAQGVVVGACGVLPNNDQACRDTPYFSFLDRNYGTAAITPYSTVQSTAAKITVSDRTRRCHRTARC